LYIPARALGFFGRTILQTWLLVGGGRVGVLFGLHCAAAAAAAGVEFVIAILRCCGFVATMHTICRCRRRHALILPSGLRLPSPSARFHIFATSAQPHLSRALLPSPNFCLTSPHSSLTKQLTQSPSQLKSTLLTLFSSIVQMVALTWYLVSYFPMGQTGLRWAANFGISRVTGMMSG
jgi:hypothetical protein